MPETKCSMCRLANQYPSKVPKSASAMSNNFSLKRRNSRFSVNVTWGAKTRTSTIRIATASPQTSVFSDSSDMDRSTLLRSSSVIGNRKPLTGVYRLFNQLEVVIASINDFGQKAFLHRDLIITDQETDLFHVCENAILGLAKMVSQLAIIMSDNISDTLQGFKSIPL